MHVMQKLKKSQPATGSLPSRRVRSRADTKAGKRLEIDCVVSKHQLKDTSANLNLAYLHLLCLFLVLIYLLYLFALISPGRQHVYPS